MSNEYLFNRNPDKSARAIKQLSVLNFQKELNCSHFRIILYKNSQQNELLIEKIITERKTFSVIKQHLKF